MCSFCYFYLRNFIFLLFKLQWLPILFISTCSINFLLNLTPGLPPHAQVSVTSKSTLRNIICLVFYLHLIYLFEYSMGCFPHIGTYVEIILFASEWFFVLLGWFLKRRLTNLTSLTMQLKLWLSIPFQLSTLHLTNK